MSSNDRKRNSKKKEEEEMNEVITNAKEERGDEQISKLEEIPEEETSVKGRGVVEDKTIADIKQTTKADEPALKGSSIKDKIDQSKSFKGMDTKRTDTDQATGIMTEIINDQVLRRTLNVVDDQKQSFVTPDFSGINLYFKFRQSYPTHFVTSVGKDGEAYLLRYSTKIPNFGNVWQFRLAYYELRNKILTSYEGYPAEFKTSTYAQIVQGIPVDYGMKIIDLAKKLNSDEEVKAHKLMLELQKPSDGKKSTDYKSLRHIIHPAEARLYKELAELELAYKQDPRELHAFFGLLAPSGHYINSIAHVDLRNKLNYFDPRISTVTVMYEHNGVTLAGFQELQRASIDKSMLVKVNDATQISNKVYSDLNLNRNQVNDHGLIATNLDSAKAERFIRELVAVIVSGETMRMQVSINMDQINNLNFVAAISAKCVPSHAFDAKSRNMIDNYIVINILPHIAKGVNVKVLNDALNANALEANSYRTGVKNLMLEFQNLFTNDDLKAYLLTDNRGNGWGQAGPPKVCGVPKNMAKFVWKKDNVRFVRPFGNIVSRTSVPPQILRLQIMLNYLYTGATPFKQSILEPRLLVRSFRILKVRVSAMNAHPRMFYDLDRACEWTSYSVINIPSLPMDVKDLKDPPYYKGMPVGMSDIWSWFMLTPLDSITTDIDIGYIRYGWAVSWFFNRFIEHYYDLAQTFISPEERDEEIVGAVRSPVTKTTLVRAALRAALIDVPIQGIPAMINVWTRNVLDHLQIPPSSTVGYDVSQFQMKRAAATRFLVSIEQFLGFSRRFYYHRNATYGPVPDTMRTITYVQPTEEEIYRKYTFTKYVKNMLDGSLRNDVVAARNEDKYLAFYVTVPIVEKELGQNEVAPDTVMPTPVPLIQGTNDIAISPITIYYQYDRVYNSPGYQQNIFTGPTVWNVNRLPFKIDNSVSQFASWLTTLLTRRFKYEPYTMFEYVTNPM
jgi:hypothetical protein